MSVESYSHDPCRKFINALKDIVNLADAYESVPSSQIHLCIKRYLAGKNWYPNRMYQTSEVNKT